MSRLALTLFGPPRIERDSCPVNTDTRKAVALLAYLAVTGQPHSRDTLAALFWPEYDQPHARATLRRTLSALHKALAGAWLCIDREALSLDRQEGFWLDVEEFKNHLVAYRTHHVRPDLACTSCLRFLEDAATLYRDDFMAGFSLADSAPFDDWQFYQADSLKRELAGVLEQLVLRYNARGDFHRAIVHARRLLTLDKLHEPAHRYLMQLYTWSGQRAAALQQYRECVKLLNEELGVRPLEETTQLYTLIKEDRMPPAPVVQSQEREKDGATPADAHSATKADELPAPAVHAVGYPLVGREDEWAALCAIYAQKASTGYLLGLEGEAGIGKTRLAEEFTAFARARGASIITVRCYEGEVDLAYGPIAAGLRAAIARRPADWHRQLASHWLSEVARLLPELGELRPDLSAPPALDSPGAQSRFFEGLRQVWLALCSGGSCLLFFDDIHWADEASLEFLSYLARRLDERPLCLLLTWRSAGLAASPRLQRLLAEAQRDGRARVFTLARLDRATVEQLLAQMAVAGLKLSSGLVRHLYRETEGVPFFLTEYLTALNRGILKAEDREWSLPGGVRDLLISRLAAIGETSRQLLATAATIGRSFDFDTLREVSGRSEEETVGGLEELIAQGLVEEIRTEAGETSNRPAHRRYRAASEQSPVYDFCHEKVRGLVYDEITLARRRLLHRRTAEALVARLRGQRETGALAGQIAHHYAAAGEGETAAEYFRQAGEYARSLYAHNEALAHFCAALALEHPATATLQEAIGDLHTFLGEYEAALKAYQEAEALNAVAKSRALLEQKQGAIYERRGEWEQAEKHFATALRILQEPGDETVKEQARIYADWSLAAHRQGDLERARTFARQALELAERARDTRALAQVHNMLGILANSHEEIETARFHLQRSLTLAEELQDTGIRAAALNNLALAYKAGGEIEQAITLTETALALCSSQGDRHREAALHSNLADLFHEAGRMDEAMNQLKLAARIYADIDVEAGTMHPEIWKLVEW